MGYTTFAQAKEFVAAGYGSCDPAITSEVVNSIRSEMYSWYAEVRLFLDAIECFRVQTFCLDCNECSQTYRGVTLPRDFQTVEAMWWNDFSVALQGDWREFQTGISPERDCRLQKLDMPGSFSTYADIMRPVHLQVVATHPDDEGKKILIRGLDGGGVHRESEFKLSLKPKRTELFASIDGRGGIVKDLTRGRVIVLDADGRVYGRYEPDETVPSYRRIKITGLRDDCEIVNIRAARRYFPLYGENDVVETDNRPAFDAMARYLKLYRRSDKDAASLAAEKDHLAKAKALVVGQQSRDIGMGTQAQVVVRTPCYGARRLGRNRR